MRFASHFAIVIPTDPKVYLLLLLIQINQIWFILVIGIGKTVNVVLLCKKGRYCKPTDATSRALNIVSKKKFPEYFYASKDC